MITLKKIGRYYKFESNIDPKLEKVIDKSLSYVKKGAQFMPNPIWGLVRLYNSKHKVFPIGLISIVKEILDSWCKQYGDVYTIEKGEKFEPLPVQLSSLRDYQVQAYKEFWKRQGGLISLPTSAGKTIIGERIISSFPKPNILVVCPTKEICKQWKDELGVMIKLKNIRIATYQKLYRELKTNKNQFEKYSLVCFDECHHCSANSLYKIGLACSNAIMLGLTATEKRTDGAEMKIRAILGNIIYKIPIQDLVKKGYVVQGVVKVIDIPKYRAKLDEEWRDIYHSAIVTNEERNLQIAEIALSEYTKGTVMIFCKYLEHGKKLFDMLTTRCFIIPNILCPKIAFINGKSKGRDKYFQDVLDGKFDIVICTKIYGEGVSIPRLKTLILASGGKSSTEIIQTTGRMLRLFPNKDKAMIYDFRDSGRSLGSHFKERMKIYQENGFEIQEEK